jgi:beta-lactamase regulating signal transducer with metallopeptidase domain
MVSVAAALTGWLATYLVHSTVLIVGAWLLIRGPRLLPETRDVLWKTALVGGVVTSVAAVLAGRSGGTDILSGVADARLLESELAIHTVTQRLLEPPLDLHPAERRWLGSAAYGRESTGGPAAGTVRVVARVVELGPECGATLRVAGVVASGERDLVERARATCAGARVSTAGSWRWFESLIALWLVGAVLGVGRLLLRYRDVRRLGARLGDPSPRTEARLADVLDRRPDEGSAVALRGLRLRVTDDVGGPCVLPGSTLVVPRRCERELTDAELRAVLAHEVAHVARRDVLWSTVLRALSAVLWIQPLNRLALSASLQDAELVCDDWALLRTGERYGLASSISRVAHWSVGRFAPAHGVAMIGRPTEQGLARRVRRILGGESRRREPAWLRATMAVALVVPMWWFPSVPPPDTAMHALVLTRTERIHDDSASAGPVRVREIRAVRGIVAGASSGAPPGAGAREPHIVPGPLPVATQGVAAERRHVVMRVRPGG